MEEGSPGQPVQASGGPRLRDGGCEEESPRSPTQAFPSPLTGFKMPDEICTS